PVPHPRQFTFITHQKKADHSLQAEFLHFPSPPLFQIFHLLKHQPPFIPLYQKLTPLTNTHIPLHPCLPLNLKISYLPHRKKHKLLSLPLHLIPRQLIQQFQHNLQPPHLS
ncbi:YqhG family protein, partial [Bacillus altitudinis]|uniref:YqhG family protein n=1 Tax=Bacillus altitudinis TaxID=293387 RepID=UPI001C92DD82